jgi:hypothetical protein
VALDLCTQSTLIGGAFHDYDLLINKEGGVLAMTYKYITIGNLIMCIKMEMPSQSGPNYRGKSSKQQVLEPCFWEVVATV